MTTSRWFWVSRVLIFFLGLGFCRFAATLKLLMIKIKKKCEIMAKNPFKNKHFKIVILNLFETCVNTNTKLNRT